MQRLLAVLALLSAVPSSAQILGNSPIALGGETTLAVALPTPVAMPTLPLAAGAKVLGMGHSYIDREAGTSATFPGVQIFARAVLPYVDALERGEARKTGLEGRVNLDICYDEAGSKQIFSGGTRLSCSDQGFSGDLIEPNASGNPPGTLARTGYSVSRTPQIVYLDIGINDVRLRLSSAQIIAMLDRQIDVLTSRGIWVVVQTLSYPKDDNQAIYAAVVPVVNAWIVEQSGRRGVRVADTVALDGTMSAPDTVFGGDLLHLSPAGARGRAAIVWPLLQSMVAAGSSPATGSLEAANIFTGKGFPGVAGTLTNATGVVATGFNLGRTTGVSNYFGSKEVIATGDEWQVVAVTPVANGTVLHSFGLKPVVAPTYASLGLAAGDWFEFSMTVLIDNWPGWDVATGDNQTGVLYAEATDSGLATQYAMYANMAAVPGKTVRLTIKGKVPAGGDRFRWSNRMIQLFHRSDTGGTGIAKFGAPVLKKIADPRMVWNLP